LLHSNLYERKATMADHITPQRSYASGVRLTIFDLVSFTVDAVPQGRPNASKDSAMRRVLLVDGGAPLPVEQRYVTADGGLYTEQDLGRARDLGDGTLVPLDDETVTAAKVGDLPKNEIALAVYPADQVEAVCRPGSGGYRLRPGAKASTKERELYATIRACVEASPDRAFVGALRLRDSRALYRLVVWQDQLVLSELIHPADLAAVDVIDVAPDEALTEKALALVEATTAKFDPAALHYDVAAAFEKAVGIAPVPAAPKLVAVADPAADLFDQALAATRPKRKPRTRKPAARKTAVA
jgi:hypothetical protein